MCFFQKPKPLKKPKQLFSEEDLRRITRTLARIQRRLAESDPTDHEMRAFITELEFEVLEARNATVRLEN